MGKEDNPVISGQLEQAIRLVIEFGASTSMLCRKMGIVYNESQKLMDEMEKLGVVGPFTGSKLRKVLVSSIDEVKNIVS